MKTPKSLKTILTLLILVQTTFMGSAQGSMDEKYYTNNSRRWLGEIPLWIPGFRGQLSYGDYNFSSSQGGDPAERERLESDFGIEFYFVGRISYKHNNVWISADAFSGKVSSIFKYTSLIGDRERELIAFTVNGNIPRLTAGYAVWKKSGENHFRIELIPYLGVRYINISLQSGVFDLEQVIDVRPNWFEPLLGFYVPVAYKRFMFEMQTDFGAVNSKSSWVISSRFRYRISELVDVQLGWNHLRLYQKQTYLGEVLKSTLNLSGPTAGVGFRF